MIDREKAVAALRNAVPSKCEMERVILAIERGEYDVVVEPPPPADEDDPTPTVRRRKTGSA